MTQIHAYLSFNGNCREAMSFYRDCIGGDLQLQTIGEMNAGACPEGTEHQIMHSSLSRGALLLMGSDMLGPEGFRQGNTMSLALDCSSEEEARTAFDKLAEGGSVGEPLQPRPWGALFGFLRDRYGVQWMLSYDKNRQS